MFVSGGSLSFLHCVPFLDHRCVLDQFVLKAGECGVSCEALPQSHWSLTSCPLTASAVHAGSSTGTLSVMVHTCFGSSSAAVGRLEVSVWYVWRASSCRATLVPSLARGPLTGFAFHWSLLVALWFRSCGSCFLLRGFEWSRVLTAISPDDRPHLCRCLCVCTQLTCSRCMVA